MNKWIERTVIAILIVIAAGWIGGCSTSKKAVKPSESAATSVSGTPFERMTALYGDWTSLRVPVTLRVSGPKNLSIGGTATMVRDKSVNISLRFFGMEIGSLYVSEDSVIVIDKVNRQCMVQQIGDFLSGFDVNISNLQDLLIGRVFILGEKKLTAQSASAFTIKNNGEGIVLTPKKQPKGFNYSFVAGDTGAVELLTVNRSEGEPILVTYSDPMETTAGAVSGSASVAARLKKDQTEIEFDWNFGKARWNDPSDLKDPKIPDNYTRRSLQDILKNVKKSL